MAMLKRLAGLVLALGFLGSAHATTIVFSTEFIAGSDWRYHYTIKNDSLAANIDEFTIFFDRNLYKNLTVEAASGGWDPVVIQPDSALPSDGFFDALAMAGGIALGDSLSGFAVRFTYLGPGSPGVQAFDIVDAAFNVIDSGFTTPVPTSPIPEPHGLMLLAIGLAAALRARQCHQKGHGEPAAIDVAISRGEHHA